MRQGEGSYQENNYSTFQCDKFENQWKISKRSNESGDNQPNNHLRSILHITQGESKIMRGF